ncbi:MAG: 4-(cytidine 5'-diphospho)-2-C-methyl-D-erythritol kinase [Thermoleophilaceae bacterium]
MIRELAPAKVNLVLRVGPVAANGLHEVCSLVASLELADGVEVEPADADSVECAGVDGPNLAEAAIRAFRDAHPLPAVRVRIEKRIPVAAGLAGGSADAAAVLRAANEIAGAPFGADRLRAIAAPLGSDVPSQVEPAHAIVSGTGERVEQVALPPIAVVLVPSVHGLSTADVFREAELLGTPRDELRCDELRAVPEMEPWEIAAHLENDLQLAAVSLRPELQITLDEMGGLGALVSGSGPTVFGLFATREGAEEAARRAPGALVTMVAAR